MAADFIEVMAKAGLVPNLCTKLVITAEAGDAVTLEWFGFADESLAQPLAKVRKAATADEAKL